MYLQTVQKFVLISIVKHLACFGFQAQQCIHCNATFRHSTCVHVTRHSRVKSLEITVKKSIIFRKQREVINEAVDRESFSCYICSYSAFSKHHLIDHMIVHDNEKYGPDYSKGWLSC
nr:unnamed protein product [Callosobruchus analis]